MNSALCGISHVKVSASSSTQWFETTFATAFNLILWFIFSLHSLISIQSFLPHPHLIVHPSSASLWSIVHLPSVYSLWSIVHPLRVFPFIYPLIYCSLPLVYPPCLPFTLSSIIHPFFNLLFNNPLVYLPSFDLSFLPCIPFDLLISSEYSFWFIVHPLRVFPFIYPLIYCSLPLVYPPCLPSTLLSIIHPSFNLLFAIPLFTYYPLIYPSYRVFPLIYWSLLSIPFDLLFTPSGYSLWSIVPFPFDVLFAFK
jgi:hypothetical protein